jgi:hypothetical protein
MGWERKLLRKIHGPICEHGVSKTTPMWNSTIYVYKVPNITSDIKTKGMEWLGHVVRIEDFRLPRKIIKPRWIKARICKT